MGCLLRLDPLHVGHAWSTEVKLEFGCQLDILVGSRMVCVRDEVDANVR
jgi:hypothetical protein